MTQPEAPDHDVLEQQQPASDAESVVGDPAERVLEAPDADVAEQEAEVAPTPSYSPPGDLALEADPADVAEQSVELGVDDEEYR